ncbi:MAG: DUF4139 domain-containing protein [Prolixibacteraceae bacterium]|jgi:hypothetical protein
MVIADEVPVSKLEEIEVEAKEISGAKLDEETGELKWNFVLEPYDKKEFDLVYSVKYPKSRTLVIE